MADDAVGVEARPGRADCKNGRQAVRFDDSRNERIEAALELRAQNGKGIAIVFTRGRKTLAPATQTSQHLRDADRRECAGRVERCVNVYGSESSGVRSRGNGFNNGPRETNPRLEAHERDDAFWFPGVRKWDPRVRHVAFGVALLIYARQLQRDTTEHVIADKDVRRSKPHTCFEPVKLRRR